MRISALGMAAGVLIGMLPCAAGAQPIEPPRGLFCSCPPTTSFSTSVVPAVAALDFVDGILVRLEWQTLEPTPGGYDWARLDEQLAAAEAAGKRVSLAIINGPQSPGWLPGLGVQMFSYARNDDQLSMPVPWDEVYLDRWLAFVAAIGQRYENDERIALVYITTSSFNGFEMQLPFRPDDVSNWNAIGYDPDLVVEGWERTIDAFAEAFPRHALSHEVHPVLGSSEVAERVVAYADQDGRFSGRVGVLGAWWMEHNALDVYPEMFELLKHASFRSASQVQVANSYTNTPDRFGPEGMGGVLDLALGSGVRYAEVWNSDLLNAALQAQLASYAELLRTPWADVNGDGVEDTDDLHAAHRDTPDLNDDGVGDAADIAIVERRIRARELESMGAGRP